MAKPGRETVPADGVTPGAAAELCEAVDKPERETVPVLPRFGGASPEKRL